MHHYICIVILRGKCLIAMDIFTCNLTPEKTMEYYEALDEYIKLTIPNVTQIDYHNIRRFPYYV